MLTEPDKQSFRNVKQDYPNATKAEKYRLMQADTLLRKCGYVRRSDGSYKKSE
jgi:hypothetical protein